MKEEIIKIMCSDGILNIDRSLYEESFLIRDFVDSNISMAWAHRSARAEVWAELEELAMK